jgi:hypothetical protein
MNPRIRMALGAVLVALSVLQFSNPARVNPPVVPGHDLLAVHPPPPEIAALLRHSCYDCHSFETQWPWYSRVAPMSWGVVSHVNDGRNRLNFSEWPNDDPAKAAKKWNKVNDALEQGEMPLPSYTWIHWSARLSTDQREKLVKWTEEEAKRLK